MCVCVCGCGCRVPAFPLQTRHGLGVGGIFTCLEPSVRLAAGPLSDISSGAPIGVCRWRGFEETFFLPYFSILLIGGTSSLSEPGEHTQVSNFCVKMCKESATHIRYIHAAPRRVAARRRRRRRWIIMAWCVLLPTAQCVESCSLYLSLSPDVDACVLHPLLLLPWSRRKR